MPQWLPHTSVLLKSGQPIAADPANGVQLINIDSLGSSCTAWVAEGAAHVVTVAGHGKVGGVEHDCPYSETGASGDHRGEPSERARRGAIGPCLM